MEINYKRRRLHRLFFVLYTHRFFVDNTRFWEYNKCYNFTFYSIPEEIIMICNNILEAIGETPIVRLSRMGDENSAQILVSLKVLM